MGRLGLGRESWARRSGGSAMLNPPDLSELVRESMDEVGWKVTETAARLGSERGTLVAAAEGQGGGGGEYGARVGGPRLGHGRLLAAEAGER